MKSSYLIFLLIFSFSAHAYTNSYYVTGYDEYGGRVYGTLISDLHQAHLYGEVTDENGNNQYFSGGWISEQRIYGQSNEGTDMEFTLY